MRVLDEFAMPGRKADALAILLPGALEPPEKFRAAGFPEAVRARRLALDLALADPGIEFIGEATGGAILRRIHEELLRPARQAGYRQIWLCGISIGGLMALAHAARYPDAADGLCLLAPYPGNRILTREILAAGGPAQWRTLAAREAVDDSAANDPASPAAGGAGADTHTDMDTDVSAGAGTAADEDGERLVWRWLGAAGTSRRAGSDRPQVHLGYGREDRFAAGLALMAGTFDAAAVDIQPGGHDWPTWRRLWDNFLDRNGWRFGTTKTAGESA